MVFGSVGVESDLRALARISFQIDPTISVKRVEFLRSTARDLVAEKRDTIRFAEQLLRQREMSGSEIGAFLSEVVA